MEGGTAMSVGSEGVGGLGSVLVVGRVSVVGSICMSGCCCTTS